MNDGIAMEIMRRMRMVRGDSHYVYRSGRHGDTYIDKHAALRDPVSLSILARRIATRYRYSDIEAVTGPETGGAVLAKAVARELNPRAGEPTPSVPVKTLPNGEHAIETGAAAHVAMHRVLLVDDVLTTGGSLSRTARAVKTSNGRIVSACVLVNRGNVTATNIDPDPFTALHLDALISLRLNSWTADACPLCVQGVPIETDLGHG